MYLIAGSVVEQPVEELDVALRGSGVQRRHIMVVGDGHDLRTEREQVLRDGKTVELARHAERGDAVAVGGVGECALGHQQLRNLELACSDAIAVGRA